MKDDMGYIDRSSEQHYCSFYIIVVLFDFES